MSNIPSVTICGCGSGGMAMAADLATVHVPAASELIKALM